MNFTATSPKGTVKEFYDSSQFAIYRRAGWVAKEEYLNLWADATNARLDGMNEITLSYFAGTICGTAERDELHRRRYPEASERTTNV